MIRATPHNTYLIATLLMLASGCASSPSPTIASKVPNNQSASHSRTPAQIAHAAQASVVTIYGYANDELVSTGTGFFIRNDGVIVTNLHVVATSETLKVELADGEIFDDVYVLSADDLRDLILLQISTSRTPSLVVADDRRTVVGDRVFVLGNPLGLRGTFSDGIVSGKRTQDGVNYLQVTAPISKGSSGGPVLNTDGKVIGVATAYFDGGQNLNMAVPARHATGMLSMARRPELFDTLMASIAQEEVAESTNTRSLETNEIMAYLPAANRESLQSMSEHEKQVTLRMLPFATTVGDKGFNWTDFSIYGTLAADGADGKEFVLPRGNYVAIGVCDNDCTDLDVVILDAEFDAVVADRELDADAAVAFEVLKPATYVVGAHMINCSTPDCVYYVQLFKR